MTDRGFLFADGVYEVIPVYRGVPFALPRHLARLAYSLQELGIDNPRDRAGWNALVEQLLAANSGPGAAGDVTVYLQVTRGAPERRAHACPPGTKATVFAMCQPLTPPGEEAVRDGVSAMTRPDIRWGRCDIKSISLLPNVLAGQAAAAHGCNEALLHRDGRVTEGASSNVFAVLGTVVVTPSKGTEILPGITRELLIEQLRGARITVQERRLTLTELRSADEVWITSSTREVLAVTKLDGEAVRGGKPGPVWKKAWALFQDGKQRVLN